MRKKIARKTLGAEQLAWLRRKNWNRRLAALAAPSKKRSQGDTVEQVQPIHMLMKTQMKRITTPGDREQVLLLSKRAPRKISIYIATHERR